MSSALLKNVTDNWRIIADEARNLSRDSIDVSHLRTRHEAAQAISDSGKLQWVDGWDGYRDWKAWGIFVGGEFIDASLTKTNEFLAKIPGLNFAAFLNLKAGTILQNHNHPENKGLLTYHLGLDVPVECYLKSDGRFYSEKNGKGFVFDGTKPHYAFNASGKDRLILHCEFKG